MVAVLQRYKVLLVILVVALLAILVWLMISGQNAEKIPYRGVFV